MTLFADLATWLVCTMLAVQMAPAPFPAHHYHDSYVVRRQCSYIDFSHQDVSDAAQHGHKVKHVPGVL